MTETTIVATGGDRVEARIRLMQRRAAAPGAALWNQIGSYMRGQYREQFRTQGAHLGRPWAPLKPRYYAWKVKAGRGRRGILVFDGGLRDSFVRKAEATQRIEGKIGYFGSDNRLAVFHQYGTHSHRTGKQVNPARPIVVRTPEMKDEIGSIVARYVVGKQPRNVPQDES